MKEAGFKEEFPKEMSADGVIVVDLKKGGLLLYEKSFRRNFGMSEATHPMNLGALVYALYTAANNFPDRVCVGSRVVHFKESEGLLCCAFGPRVLCDAALGDRMFTPLAIDALVRMVDMAPEWIAIKCPRGRKILVRCEENYREVERHRGAENEMKKSSRRRCGRFVEEKAVWHPTPNSIACDGPRGTVLLVFPPTQTFVSSADCLAREAADLVPILF